MTQAERLKWLQRLTDDLEAVHHALFGLVASLPESPEEKDELSEIETVDPITELRSILQCVQADYLQPALAALRNALASLKA
jgi:hypothetical protein